MKLRPRRVSGSARITTPTRPASFDAEVLEDRRLLAATPFDTLVFSKTAAFRHDSIDEGIAAIRQLGAANNFTVTATEDAAVFSDAGLADYKVVVFLSTTGDVLNATQQAAFERFIGAGNGYVGIHAAADTEYNWPWYGGLVGAYFASHPAIQQATVVVADRVHRATAGLPERWVRTDEWYNYRLNPRGNVHVLATLDEKTYAGGAMGFDHPIAWVQNYSGGRSFYTGIGHTAATYSEANARRHLLGGIEWAAGVVPGNAGATVADNYRKTVLEPDVLDPMELDVAPDGRVFFVERGGRVKAWSPATGATALLATIPVTTGDEDGLLGLALDPQFATNGWAYLFYSPVAGSEQRVSRFTVTGNTLDRASERVLLRIPVDRGGVAHSGGSLAFGPDGSLYISTGDNTNPFESDGFTPIDERPGRQRFDAQRSAGNAADLRGKILRILPQPDGTYALPDGNLFPAGTPGRPEVYAMGLRNPFRISVDSETGWLYWGDVGPDAVETSPTRGPRGYDEFNQARAAGNFGWPYFVADNQAYNDYNFATNTAGAKFNPAAPVNDSPNNTGPRNLPPAQPALIWYPYAASAQFPELGSGGRTAMAGPVYHFDPAASSPFKLPEYYDDTLFVYEWSRNWIKEVKLDANGRVLKINPFAPNLVLNRPMDMDIGPDGAMYVLEWGGGFGGGSADAQLVRIDYLGNPPPPPTPRVVGRHVFYNNTVFDGSNTSPDAADDASIATDKQARLPGQSASFSNVTSFTQGLNGIMIDVENLPAGPTPQGVDFDFRSSPTGAPGSFVPGPRAGQVAIRRGAGDGGSDRITLIWDPGGGGSAVEPLVDGWLEVTLRPSERTGLAAPDVFYFGNLVGESGDAAAPATLTVSALDLSATKRALNQNATITTRTDFNRDGRVNALDLAAVRSHLNRRLPLPGAAAPALAPTASGQASTFFAPPAPSPETTRLRRAAEDLLS